VIVGNDGDTCVASELASSAGPGESDSPTESSTGSPSGGAATGVSHAETKGDAMALSRSIQSGGNEAASSPLHPEQHSLSEAADFDDVTDADLALMLELDLQVWFHKLMCAHTLSLQYAPDFTFGPNCGLVGRP
jgi:hypothetical protein